MHLTRETQISY